MTSPRPTYLETAPDPTFALYHEAAARPGAAAVLICPPWGWDEVASYRSRRAWAERLAAAGHPTLRCEPQATGNSGGSPRDPRRLEAWIDSISTAADWLRATSGCPAVAVLGLGLGGLLAREALQRGARFEELVLWAAPVSGRSFARETRAFSRLQAWHAAEAEQEREQPEGSLEAGGFLLTAETLDSLKGLSPEVPEGSPLERVLLLERDGVAVDEGLRDAFEAAGLDVGVAPGNGWAQLVSHAERSRLSLETADRVAAWLADGEARAPALSLAPGPGDGSREIEELVLEGEGLAVREFPFAVELPFGRAFGLLAEPADDSGISDLCAVCLNAGAVRHIGPNRIWVETSRRWAAKGVRTLRIDLDGIGESDGEPPPDVASFYLPKFEQQLGLVLDALEERGLGDRFLLAGLCGGGYWAFRAALGDARVSTALLLNSGALEWDVALIDHREARKLGRAADPGQWRRLIRGEVGFARLWKLLRSLPRDLGRRLKRLGQSSRETAVLEADLDRLREAGVSLTMAFSEREALFEELEESGVLSRLDRWPAVELARLPGDDHTLRPIAAQAGARRVLDQGLERAMRAGRDSRATGRGPSGEARPAAPTRRR